MALVWRLAICTTASYYTCSLLFAQEAAAQLGIGLSVLKRVCRTIGLARWPYRKRQSLRNVVEQTKLYLNVRA